jgi:hypothetical protein
LSRLLYLYGFVPAGTQRPELTGVGGGPVELLPAAGFAAVYSAVDPGIYSPDSVEARLGDLNWVGEQGLAHERVVAWFVDHAVIVPVPLLTLYSGTDALRAEAERRDDEIRSLLERFRGVREWDLKVSYDSVVAAGSAALLSPTLRAIDDEIRHAGPGRRYLLERKREAALRSEVGAAVRERARALFDSLQAHAQHAVTLPIPAADALPVVLHAALLVPAAAEAALARHAATEGAALAGMGIHVALSGPWAPYRFLDTTHE